MRRSRHRTGLIIGSALAALATWAYIEWGSWDMPTPWTFTAPRDAWARVVFAPGVAVARACFDAVLRDIFRFRVALGIAGAIGVGTMAVVGGAVGLLIAHLRKR